MRFPVDNFEANWNITAGYSYGDPTSYGYHEADDMNLNGGGNIDLGQPLYAVADGNITSVHVHTTSPTFGKHLHLNFKVDGKDYWAHYAHCNEIFVTEGQQVKTGDKIATCGNTGTTFAHLHFAIKNQPTGIDGIAKTLEDLKKWENPTQFIKAHQTQEVMAVISQKNLDAIIKSRDEHWNELQSERTTVVNLNAQLQTLQAQVSAKESQISTLNGTVSSLEAQIESLSNQANNNTDIQKQLDQCSADRTSWFAERESLNRSIGQLKRQLDLKKPKTLLEKILFVFS